MKITIGGETFDVDLVHMPMSEALAIERGWGRRYAEWETELQAGSAEAMAVLVWRIWCREGRDVGLQDILDGKIDFDYREMLRSLNAAAEEQAPQEVPTSGAAPRTAPDGTDTTPSVTRERSPKSSA